MDLTYMPHIGDSVELIRIPGLYGVVCDITFRNIVRVCWFYTTRLQYDLTATSEFTYRGESCPLSQFLPMYRDYRRTCR